MPMRSSSLANNPLAITRELDGRYDVVLEVRDNLDLIEQVAGIDFATILAELESAQDFTGITVVQGETVAWDAVNKILTVPKGDKGDKGDTGLTGPQGVQGIQGIQGIKGDTGSQGPKGDTGNDLTITQIIYNGNGTFNWLFSDGTTYATPDLKGPKGDTGDQGIKGDQGISVHHLKGTSTTNPNGDFGTSPFKDTYTFYGDADETLNLGWFVVTNGVSDGMSVSVYDVDANGIVDNSERLGGELPSHYVNVTTDQTVAGSKTFAGNVVVQGDLTGTSFNSITGLASVAPLVAGTAAVGTSTLTARQDHVHPVQTTISGNAGTATTLATPRLINGTSFNGSADITVPVNTTQKSDAVSYNIPFVSNITEGNQSLYTESVSSLTYNPSTNTLATATFAGALAGNANTATRVNNAEVIKFDTGVTEGTDLYTFDGSAAKTINIKAGTNVTLTKTAGSVTINANDTSIAVTEITGMGAGASTFLATPTSTNLAAMLTDETGTGAVVFANSPTLTGTPLATTAVVGTNTTQVATTAYVIAEINKVEEW